MYRNMQFERPLPIAYRCLIISTPDECFVCSQTAEVLDDAAFRLPIFF
jgi:hypothetical protein